MSENDPIPNSISPAEVDLARIAAYGGHQDGYLLELIRLADRNLGLAVGLLLNGMVVVGSLAPPEHMAKEVDSERSRLAEQARIGEKPENLTDEEWEQILEDFSTATSAALREFREELQELDSELEQIGETGRLDPANLPADLARRMIYFQARSFLTLKNVQIAAPAQVGSMKLGVLRVAVSQVDAWWPLRLDEHGKASFKLFSTDPGEEP
ncbi:MAG TPA: hypothetical protein VG448_14060 [Solirubrobacterales bacterium]|nr:hypothetical protein [Solirubrobacterales bacterium]